MPEEVIPRPENVPTGGAWDQSGRKNVKVDITLKRTRNGKSETLRIQTVTTLSDGVTPNQYETLNGNLITEARPNDTLLQIPKDWPIGPPLAPFTTAGEGLRNLFETLEGLVE